MSLKFLLCSSDLSVFTFKRKAKNILDSFYMLEQVSSDFFCKVDLVTVSSMEFLGTFV